MTLVKLMVEVHISATITYSGMIVGQWIHYGEPQTSVPELGHHLLLTTATAGETQGCGQPLRTLFV